MPGGSYQLKIKGRYSIDGSAVFKLKLLLDNSLIYDPELISSLPYNTYIDFSKRVENTYDHYRLTELGIVKGPGGLKYSLKDKSIPTENSQFLVLVFIQAFHAFDTHQETQLDTSLSETIKRLQKQKKTLSNLFELFTHDPKSLTGNKLSLYQATLDIFKQIEQKENYLNGIKKFKESPATKHYLDQIDEAYVAYLKTQDSFPRKLFSSISANRVKAYNNFMEIIKNDINVQTPKDIAWQLMRAIIDIKADHEASGFFASRGIRTESRLAKQLEHVFNSMLENSTEEDKAYLLTLKAYDIASKDLRKWHNIENTQCSNSVITELSQKAHHAKSPQEIINFLETAKSNDAIPKEGKHCCKIAIQNIQNFISNPANTVNLKV